jgi:hypothetical protein
MEQINESVKKNLSSEDSVEFIEKFDDTFPQNKRSIQTLINEREIENNNTNQNSNTYSSDMVDIDGGTKKLLGGQNYYPPPQNNYSLYNQYNYPPPHNYSYPRQYSSSITKKPEEKSQSKLAYEIKIDMDLHPGTSLTPEQIEKSKCNNKYNAIRKSYAEFRGKPYIIQPVYPQKPEQKTKKNTQQAKGGRKTRKNII